MTPHAFAAGRRAAAPAAVDRYVLRAERSAAKPPHAAAAVKRGTDRQTEGRPTVTQILLRILCGQCQ